MEGPMPFFICQMLTAADGGQAQAYYKHDKYWTTEEDGRNNQILGGGRGVKEDVQKKDIAKDENIKDIIIYSNRAIQQPRMIFLPGKQWRQKYLQRESQSQWIQQLSD